MGSNPRSQTWRCSKADGSVTFAKITTSPYPSALHEEAASKNLVPKLRPCEDRFPGSQYLVEMEFLEPQIGWIALSTFAGDWPSAEQVLYQLLHQWQTCGEGKAVHGDLRPPNIFLRYAALSKQ